MRVSRRLTSALAGMALVVAILAAGPLHARAAQTYTVDTNADTAVAGCTGPTFTGSLRQCVDAANAAGGTNTIVFAASTDVLPFVLLNGQLVIDSQVLTITGDGETKTIVDGNAASRIFQVNSSATVTMSALTLRNGSLVNSSGVFNGGGAIRTDGALTLSHVTVTGNSASSGTTGTVTSGAIWENNGSLTLDNATVTNNTVSATNDAAAGAIQVCCSGGPASVKLTITNSLFKGNVAKINTGTTGAQAYGGAVTANSDGLVSISNTIFTENSVTVPASNNGGAGAVLSHGTMTIASSTFTKNKVDVPDGGSAGAIENCCGGATTSMTITDSLIEGNSVTGTGSDSGGVSNCCGAKLTVSGTTIDNNTVTGTGVTGGGLSNSSTDQAVTITNSTIYKNTASGTNSAGGNLFLNRCGTPPCGQFTLDNATVDAGAAATGPNIALARDATMSLTNTIIAGSPGSNCNLGPGTTVTDGGHNLEDSAASTCNLSVAKSDVLVSNAGLAGLASNGGPTPTQALVSGSPAIDHGLNSACPSTDQRGDPRFSAGDPVCDIGAFEVQQAAVVPPVPPAGTPVPWEPAVVVVILGSVLLSGARRVRR